MMYKLQVILLIVQLSSSTESNDGFPQYWEERKSKDKVTNLKELVL